MPWLDLNDLDVADNLDIDLDGDLDLGGLDLAEDLDVGDLGIDSGSYDLGGFDDFGGYDGAFDVDAGDFGGGYFGDDDFGDFIFAPLGELVVLVVPLPGALMVW